MIKSLNSINISSRVPNNITFGKKEKKEQTNNETPRNSSILPGKGLLGAALLATIMNINVANAQVAGNKSIATNSNSPVYQKYVNKFLEKNGILIKKQADFQLGDVDYSDSKILLSGFKNAQIINTKGAELIISNSSDLNITNKNADKGFIQLDSCKNSSIKSNCKDSNKIILNNCIGTDVKVTSGHSDVELNDGANNTVCGTNKNDNVINHNSHNAKINTKGGNDQIENDADFCEVDAGAGNDYVITSGDFNITNLGKGDDMSTTTGHNNKDLAGAGTDSLETTNDSNYLDGEKGQDKYIIPSDFKGELASYKKSQNDSIIIKKR